MKKIAVSACLLGQKCRYDGIDNRNETLLEQLKDCQLIPFCPEDFAFGTPRPTMDLMRTKEGDKAISNADATDLTFAVNQYAIDFFTTHPEIDLFIGKDRSPSCGVCSARLYDTEKNLLSDTEAGLMAKEALRRGIECFDAEDYV